MSISNGDTNKIWCFEALDANNVSQPVAVRGLGSFHKTLPHNEFGEVDTDAFAALVSATRGDGREFSQVPSGAARAITSAIAPCPTVSSPPKKAFAFAAGLTNPQAGLAKDPLIHAPSDYVMPPAPRVMSNTTAAEMLELYWMAILRDVDLCADGATTTSFGQPLGFGDAAKEIDKFFGQALASDDGGDAFLPGVDLPGPSTGAAPVTAANVFRLGLPGDDVGPMVSQFFLRPVAFGTQTIDQRQRPYKADMNYLTAVDDWLGAQNSGCDDAGQAYSKANEDVAVRYEECERYIATMRDLARFVNKDALHQAYFNAALILLSGEAKWGLGNPYHKLGDGPVQGMLPDREAGFGVLGGPHLLALVSEVATRALKVVWQQKWQQHLRLRPEAYGGLVQMENIGADIAGTLVKRPYKLPSWLVGTDAATAIAGGKAGTYLLPMAFRPGSPTHPAYGAGHATVAGACVTILKAWFQTFTTDAYGNDKAIAFKKLRERNQPYGESCPITCYCTTLEKCPGLDPNGQATKLDNRGKLTAKQGADKLTIEGELNKLAQNVAMGRSMGGVHWRTDNTRSLMLGEALAAEVLARITTDANEKPFFEFRTFARRADGQPRKVHIEGGRIYVDGVEKAIPASSMI